MIGEQGGVNMPIKIPKELPAYQVLSDENVFVMSNERANSQDIRPLKIVILNLMPKKIQTETQLLRYLANTPLQVEVTFMKTESYTTQHTSLEHMDRFYCSFSDIKAERFDGLIITGAPVERLDFQEVLYWDELKMIMEWSKSHVYSTLHICWGAQAGLYYHYHVPKYNLKHKLFGVFKHYKNKGEVDLMQGVDDFFDVPHSRYSEIKREDIKQISELEILSESDEAGVCIVSNQDRRQIFITGPLEYERETLKEEYFRDIKKGFDIPVPKNYFLNDDFTKQPMFTWRSTASIIFSNWLNYCVYQHTPYDLEKLMAI